MDSDPKDEEMLVQILQELSTQDAGSSAASILTRMFVHFPINLNGNTIAQPPPNTPQKNAHRPLLCLLASSQFCCFTFYFSPNESDS